LIEAATKAFLDNIDPIETECLIAVLLLICRCLYENQDLVEVVKSGQLQAALKTLSLKPVDLKVKETIGDINLLLG